MARYADLDPEVLRRAAKLAQLPGVTRSAAAERFGLSVGVLRRAVKEHGAAARASRAELVLHCISRAGREAQGELGDLRTVASYLDYVNKDGSVAADVRALLEQLVAEGKLALDGPRWRLIGEFP